MGHFPTFISKIEDPKTIHRRGSDVFTSTSRRLFVVLCFSPQWRGELKLRKISRELQPTDCSLCIEAGSSSGRINRIMELILAKCPYYTLLCLATRVTGFGFAHLQYCTINKVLIC